MPASVPLSARAAAARSSRTHWTIASASVQRRSAGGVTAMRLLFASSTASSRTRSLPPHSPGPSMAGIEGATARASVRRSRQAEGGSASAGAGACSDGALASGRDRGSGTICARARSPIVMRRIKAARSFAAMAVSIAFSSRLVCGPLRLDRGGGADAVGSLSPAGRGLA